MRFQSLRDLDDTEGTVLLHDSSTDGHLIYHPNPNPNDPNDPLRWPKWKKYFAFATVLMFSFVTTFTIGGMAPALYPLSVDFHKTQSETTGLILWPLFTLGLFNFFWIPMGNYFGKRPIFVISTLLLSMACLWGAVAKSFGSLFWSSIVASAAGAASEGVTASVVNDVFFLHERASIMGWFQNAACAGNTIGPIICGFVVTYSSWRVHKWLAFGLAFLNFLLVLLFVPETRYDRSFLKPDDSSDISTPSSLAEKSGGSTHIQAPSIPPKTYFQTLTLYSPLPKNTSLLTLFLRPFPLIAYPAVIVSLLAFSISIVALIAINTTSPFVLQNPPYNFKASINGLINIPGLIGNLAGAAIGGSLSDRYSDWRSKKNSGIFQPETRLHLLIVPTLIAPAGCLLWGYGVERELGWPALFVSYGLVSVGITAIATTTMTYVSDSYFAVNADALTLIQALKNIIPFGCLYAITPWVNRSGYVNAFATQAGIYVLIMLLAIPLLIWGPKLRHVTARWKIIL